MSLFQSLRLLSFIIVPSSAHAVVGRPGPTVQIIDPEHGRPTSAETITVALRLDGLDASRDYRLMLNGEVASADFDGTATEWTIGGEILPERGFAMPQEGLSVLFHGDYAYPGWVDDSSRLYRPLHVELVETGAGGEEDAIVAADRILITDLRRLRHAAYAAPEFVDRDVIQTDAIGIQLTSDAVADFLPALVLEHRPHRSIAPFETRASDFIASGEGLVSSMSSERCTTVSDLDVIELGSDYEMWRLGMQAAVLLLPDCHDIDALLEDKCVVDNGDVAFCAEPSEAGIVTELEVGGPESLEIETQDDWLLSAWSTGEIDALASQGFMTRVKWSPSESLGPAARSLAEATQMWFPEGEHDCIDMPYQASGTEILDSVHLLPDPASTDRTLARTTRPSHFTSDGELELSGLCAESFLDDAPDDRADIVAFQRGVKKRINGTIQTAWREGARSNMELHLLIEDALSFANVGRRESGDHVSLTAPIADVVERELGPDFVPDASVTDPYGIRWELGSKAVAVEGIGTPFVDHLEMRSLLPTFTGAWVPDALSALDAPDEGTPYDLSLVVGLHLLNQTLAAAASTELLRMELTEAGLTYAHLDACGALPAGVDCADPVLMTGNGLSPWIPQLGHLGSTPLRIMLEPTLAPTITMQDNHILAFDDEWQFLEEGPGRRLFLNVGQVQLSIAPVAHPTNPVLIVDIDIFDPNLNVDLAVSDSRLEVEAFPTELDIRVHEHGLEATPAEDELRLAVRPLVDLYVLPGIESALESIPVPEIANLPAGVGLGQEIIAEERIHDQLWWFLALE